MLRLRRLHPLVQIKHPLHSVKRAARRHSDPLPVIDIPQRLCYARTHGSGRSRQHGRTGKDSFANDKECEMINRDKVEWFQQEPVAERLRLMELILQSIKRDIETAPPKDRQAGKAFRVREFCLGQDVAVDRDSIYTERSL